jgi:Fe-S-cluster-containing dehydrogenase component
MTQLALVIDLNVCVGCHACVTSCKQWNTSGAAGPLVTTTPTAPTRPAPSSTACRPSRSASSRTRRPCTSPRAACTARTRPACRCARPARRTSARRTASCWSTTTSASAASTAPGPAPTARASSTKSSKVMKKCTLCVDRIYDTSLPEGRPQAGLRAGLPDQRAPVRRHPRPGIGGVDRHPREWRLPLMPEWGTQAGQPLPAAAQDLKKEDIRHEVSKDATLDDWLM